MVRGFLPRKALLLMVIVTSVAFSGFASLPLVEAQDQGRLLEQTPAPTQALKRPGKFYALVIGINDYQSIKRLVTATKDADAVDTILKTLYGFETRLLKNATREQILVALNDYRRELDASASLLIYYAGHGHYDQEVDKAYWLPVDAHPNDNVRWISADDITTNIKGIPANHILIISDSCYSGMIQRDSGASITPSEKRRYLQKMLDGKSRVLMASGGNEPVADGGGDGHSVFARALIRGFEQIDQPAFTSEELFYQFIREAVSGKSNQTPKYSVIQNSGHESGDFVFFKRGGGLATTASPNLTPDRNLGSKADPQADADSELWAVIQYSPDAQMFRNFLNRYPNSQYKSQAQARLTQLEKSSTGAGTPAGEAGVWEMLEDQRVIVPTKTAWTPTNLKVEAGQKLSINGSGSQANFGVYGYGGPDGVAQSDPSRPLRDCPTGALIAKIGNDMTCVRSQVDFTARTAGELSLGINAGRVAGNSGSFIARVRIFYMKH